MFSFHPLTFSDRAAVRADLFRTVPRTCDYTFGGVMLWRDFFQVQAARTDRSLIYRILRPDGIFCQPPADPSPELLRQIREDFRSRGEPCRFCFVPEERLPVFETAFPEGMETEEERDWADYLYEKQDLISYPGKRFRGQRNHVNQFCMQCTPWQFRKAEPEDLPSLKAFYARFREENRKDSPTWLAEDRMLREVLDRFEAYGFLCGILTVAGAVVGFSMGEISGDTLTVHTEKAERDVPGAYPMLASHFPALFAGDSVRYVNREDDAGDEGLRRSKLSYHPCALLKKYKITVL